MGDQQSCVTTKIWSRSLLFATTHGWEGRGDLFHISAEDPSASRLGREGAHKKRTDQESICTVRRDSMLAQRLGLPNLRGAQSFVVATFIDFLGTRLLLPLSLLH